MERCPSSRLGRDCPLAWSRSTSGRSRPALLVSVLASALGCPVDRLPDATPRLALLEADAWAVGFLADGPVGVGDVVTLPVVLDLGQGAPPGAATAHAGGRLAKLTQVGGSVGAGEQLGGAAA